MPRRKRIEGKRAPTMKAPSTPARMATGTAG